jgi:hypothetical protein
MTDDYIYIYIYIYIRMTTGCFDEILNITKYYTRKKNTKYSTVIFPRKKVWRSLIESNSHFYNSYLTTIFITTVTEQYYS